MKFRNFGKKSLTELEELVESSLNFGMVKGLQFRLDIFNETR